MGKTQDAKYWGCGCRVSSQHLCLFINLEIINVCLLRVFVELNFQNLLLPHLKLPKGQRVGLKVEVF